MSKHSTDDADRPADPTEVSLWRPLRPMLNALDSEIAKLYDEFGIDDLKPSYAMELIRLYLSGPMTIRELADSVELTHAAVSQKVAALRTAGWVRTRPGPDRRTKQIALTAKAKRVVPRLMAEWRATEAALADIEAEIPYALSKAVDDILEALRRKSFHDRILERLERDPEWHS